MFRNYFVTTLRSIARHKLFSFITIGGLAVGLACVALVVLFVRDETSYDHWIIGTDNLFRVEMTLRVPGRPPLAMAMVPFPMPAAMRDEIPGVTGMTRVYQSSLTLTAGDRQFRENAMAVDPGFFKLIRLPLIAGDRDTIFQDPESVVLSQSAARKFFGVANPVGRILTTARSGCDSSDIACQRQVAALKVTGVFADLPHNTQLAADAFIPNTSIADRTYPSVKQDWYTQAGWAYVSLAPHTDPNAVVAKMAPILDREVTPILKKVGIPSRGSEAYKVQLTPFAQVHLASGSLQFNMTTPGSWTTVYGVAAVGVLILLTACFNFTNLSTARATLRAHEVGLRKTVGAKQSQIIQQFLGEAVLMALAALALALALVELVLPAFNQILQKNVSFSYIADWRLLILLIGVAVGAGLLGGVYPALVLSGFRPSSALNPAGSGRGGPGRMRNLLVILQFAVSIGLGIAAVVVFSQISFARSIDLGFQRDNIVFVGAGSLSDEQRRSLAEMLRRNPGIVEVGMADRMPLQPGQATFPVKIPGQPETVTLNRVVASPEFPTVFGIRLVAGRLLSETRSDDRIHSLSPDSDPMNDGRNILINEAAAKQLGFTPQQAVGKIIFFHHSQIRIAGVLADSKIHGAREPVKPTAYAYLPDYPMDFAIRLRPELVPSSLAFIDRSWHAFSPTAAIQRLFFSDVYDGFYRGDERQGRMFSAFVAIAVIIACMGLFGLAAFTAGRRTKEIGVRKVFGARIVQIVWLLVAQFSWPVLLANLIAWPLAWYYLNSWLQGFAYRIALSPVYFVEVGLAALLIAWATVFSHALRVARANPIHALRAN